MSLQRLNRISVEFKKEISDIIRNEIKDPRIAELTSIMSVEITRDLKYAKVFVSVYGDDKAREETIEGLRSAAGFIRKEMGKRVKIRYNPEIIFELDNSIEYGMHISKIIDDINNK